jgi:hypothetical protein
MQSPHGMLITPRNAVSFLARSNKSLTSNLAYTYIHTQIHRYTHTHIDTHIHNARTWIRNWSHSPLGNRQSVHEPTPRACCVPHGFESPSPVHCSVLSQQQNCPMWQTTWEGEHEWRVRGIVNTDEVVQWWCARMLLRSCTCVCVCVCVLIMRGIYNIYIYIYICVCVCVSVCVHTLIILN